MSESHQSVPEKVRERVERAFERHKRGDISFATRVYREVLADYPDHSRSLHYLGVASQQTGNAAQAIQLLERSIAADSNDPRAYNHLGLIHVSLDEKKAAAECFERGLQVDPNHIELLNNLANVMRTRDLVRAISLYRRAVKLNPKAGFLAYNLAQALDEDQSFDEALEFYKRAIDLDPRHSKARHSLGILLEQRGKFNEAIEQYLVVQRLDPRHVSSLANVLALRDFVPDAPTVRRAEELLQASNLLDEDRIKLHRGLGKHYEREGAYDEAFSHFKRAKAIFKQSRPKFNLESVAKNMQRLKHVFSDKLFFSNEFAPSGSERPIFIVGLPRSGTTLIEQILASHPLVFGAGELGDIPRIVKYLRPEYPEQLRTMGSAEISEYAGRYLSVIDALASPEEVRVTDKMPLNSVHLGLIAKLFPKCHIVYCRRDPMDIAISSFVEMFDLEQDYTTDFADFGRYFLEHELLMAHWRTVLPIPIHEICYEELIAEPERITRALVQYCGLEWHPKCLEFQKSQRTIQTPSRWQVRQPIYRTSVGRWRHYSSQMEPLHQLLKSSGYSYSTEPHSQSSAKRGARSNVLVSDLSAEMTTSERVPAALDSPLFIVAAPRSGSTLLFETLARSKNLCTVGGEAHWLVENVPELRPGAPGVESNRLTSQHVTEDVRDFVMSQIMEHLVDNAGVHIERSSAEVFFEKTPKNALRIPFFERIFPKSRFVFLWRDPKENISSIIEAWRSGRFVTYKHLPGFTGSWSLLLPPGYEHLNNRPIEEIAAFQWECANRIILDDLAALDPKRWIALDYFSLVADPAKSVERILKFAGVNLDPAFSEYIRRPLPHSRYTQTAPAPEKWRANEAEVERVLPAVNKIWKKLQNLI